MPTPLGHSILGLAVERIASPETAVPRKRLGWIALAVCAANLPDADFLMAGGGTVTLSGLWHHGPMHSLFFAVTAGALTAAWGRWRRSPHWRRAGMVVLLGVASHVLADLLTVDGYPANGIGVPLFWPFSDEYVQIGILPSADRANPVSWRTAVGIGAELLVTAPVAAAAVWWRKRTAQER